MIESGASNFPLNVKVPASRPTLPIKNSTAPENVIAFSSPRLHCASEALDPSQTLDLGSAATKLPFQSARASKRTERCWSFANVISTFQVPITLGDCASLTAMLWVIRIEISTRATLIMSRNPHCWFRQGMKALYANGEVHPATCWMPRAECARSPIARTLEATVAAPELDEVSVSRVALSPTKLNLPMRVNHEAMLVAG